MRLENLKSVGESTQKCGRKNREWRWRQIKSVYMWYLDVVVKRLRCIDCLNPWVTNCTTFWSQKFFSGTVFLHKNDAKQNSSTLIYIYIYIYMLWVLLTLFIVPWKHRNTLLSEIWSFYFYALFRKFRTSIESEPATPL